MFLYNLYAFYNIADISTLAYLNLILGKIGKKVPCWVPWIPSRERAVCLSFSLPMSDDERKQRRKKSKKKKKKEKRGYRSPQDRPKEWTEKTIQLRKMGFFLKLYYVRQILALPGNLECAECANKYPDWSSINLG
eukprot:1381259-Amorphochlora_amoeboformis.AAC.1